MTPQQYFLDPHPIYFVHEHVYISSTKVTYRARVRSDVVNAPIKHNGMSVPAILCTRVPLRIDVLNDALSSVTWNFCCDVRDMKRSKQEKISPW